LKNVEVQQKPKRRGNYKPEALQEVIKNIEKELGEKVEVV
jgi:hypothetical protein